MLKIADRDHQFPTLRTRFYLNTAAEGIPPLAAREALATYHAHKSMGMAGRDLLFAEADDCRNRVADLLALSPGEISFCSSASEAYNLLASAIAFQAGDEVVITDLDFPAGATPWLQLPVRPAVHLWRNREGVLDPADLSNLLSNKTRLVQVSLVSFLTGHRIAWGPVRDAVRRHAPQAILAVDVTQAAGRIVLDCLDADCLIASCYKWLLGSHGGCVVAVPDASSHRVTARAGGWYHLENAFDDDRFERAAPHPGARSFAVGMPPFPAIYALRAGIDALLDESIPSIAKHADKLVNKLHDGLAGLGIRTMSPKQPDSPSGIVAFQTENDEALHAHLLGRNIHVMHQAGRIRLSIHGYNRMDEVREVLRAIEEFPG